MTCSTLELGSPAVATGSLVGPSASRYEVVRYPAAGVAPEWQELHCAANSEEMSSSQLTGWASVPSRGRAFEHEHTASATARHPCSARIRASGGLVGMHQADRRDPVRPVADQALLLLRFAESDVATLPDGGAVGLHVVDRGRGVVA